MQGNVGPKAQSTSTKDGKVKEATHKQFPTLLFKKKKTGTKLIVIIARTL